MLVHVVKVCQAILTEDMLFARYGGEEFVLALSGSTGQEGAAVANQLRTAIETKPLITAEGEISVTLSCGVAEVSKANHETMHQLLNHADKALYIAKRQGRNQVQVF